MKNRAAQRSFSSGKFKSGQWRSRVIRGNATIIRSIAAFLSFKRSGVDRLAKRCFPHYRVVDFGCGRGAYSLWFLERCPCSILAVDWSPEALKGFDGVPVQGKILRVCADLQMLPFKEESIHALFSIDVLGHLSDQQQTLKEIFRVCCPGAPLFLHSECSDYRTRWPDSAFIRKCGSDYLAELDGHIAIRTSNEMRTLLRHHFTITRFFSPAGILGWLFGYPDKYFFVYKKKAPGLLNLLMGMFSLIKKTPLLGVLLRLTNSCTNHVELLLRFEGGGSCFAEVEKPMGTTQLQDASAGIDIIIPTYQRAASTPKLVESLLGQCSGKDAIYVVSQDATLPELPESSRVHLLISSPPNLPAARNMGIKASHNPIILFLDDDVTIEGNLLVAHRKCYRNPEIGGVAGYVEDPCFDKSTDIPSRFDPATGRIIQNFSSPKSGFTISMMGAHMSFRRSVLMSIGGFDTNFKRNAHFEDVDCAFRLLKTGYKIWYCSDARVSHLRCERGGCRSDSSSKFLYHSYANSTYFSLKYAPFSRAGEWIQYWKYRLEFDSRKKGAPGSLKPVNRDYQAVLAGLLGAIAGAARFYFKGERKGLPDCLGKRQEELHDNDRMGIPAN